MDATAAGTEGGTGDVTQDGLLLLGLGTLVLVGSFANDIAGETWEKVQEEVSFSTNYLNSSLKQPSMING